MLDERAGLRPVAGRRGERRQPVADEPPVDPAVVTEQRTTIFLSDAEVDRIASRVAERAAEMFLARLAGRS